MNITLIRTNTSLRSLSVASLNRIRIFPIPTQRPSIDNSVAKQPQRMRTFCTLFSDVQIQAFKLGLDFITEHEKGFRRMLQSKLCALMEARENYLAIVWLCRIEKRELESKRVRERESWLAMITFLFAECTLHGINLTLRVRAYISIYMTLICKQQLHLLHTNTVTVCVCVHVYNTNRIRAPTLSNDCVPCVLATNAAVKLLLFSFYTSSPIRLAFKSQTSI